MRLPSPSFPTSLPAAVADPVADAVADSAAGTGVTVHRRSRTAPALVAGAVLLLYAAHSLREHRRFGTTGYDLGIFGQAVRAYAEFRLPASEIRTATAPSGFTGDAYPLLADHFHPVLALLGPLYRLFPHVEVLLLAQSALIALSVYVVARAAQRHLPRPGAGVAIGLAYGLCWGLQQLAAFDFHEVAFAVPLLALACRAHLDGRWVAAACWAGSLVLVKEDLGATAAVFGLLLIRHHRRAGIALCAFATVSTVLVVGVVLPAWAPDGRYGYLDQPHGYGLLDGWPVKSLTLLALLAVTAGTLLRSPLGLLLLPTLAWRLTSPNPAYWGPELHYSAVLVPIAFAALVDVLRRGVRLPHVVPLLVSLLLLPAQPLRDLVVPGFWRDGPRQVAARAALARVPDGARVAASNGLAPHLVDRARVHLVADGVLDLPTPVEWIVVDTRDAFPPGAVDGVLRRAEGRGWRRVHAADGIVVLRAQRAYVPSPTRQYTYSFTVAPLIV
ncbi:DUF2079 domain-containing protein [Streptomyces sp. NPDC056470]|uniref:DUF2079 domain-containing protein n=1 Tax=Streptomyces sp. NPDC056470 TaxID=3345831 RepID=UPI0036A79FF0